MKESPRAIGPRRSERVKASTTKEVKSRLERMARKHGWTMSKTVHLVLKAGLEVLERGE